MPDDDEAAAQIRGTEAFKRNLELLTSRIGSLKWISYSPRNYDDVGGVSEDQIAKDLELLSLRGFNGIICYTSAGSFGRLPEIARRYGFEGIIAGIWTIDSDEEFANVEAAKEFISGVSVGNERLNRVDGYTMSELKRAMARALVKTGKPVSTSEERAKYFSADSAELIGACDWLLPNIHPYWDGAPTPEEAVQKVLEYCDGLRKLTDKAILVKETGWPTNGGTSTSELAQRAFYEALHLKPLHFSTFEAFDSPWKTHEPEEPYWGVQHPDGTMKLVLAPDRYADVVVALLSDRRHLVLLDTMGNVRNTRLLDDGLQEVVWSSRKNVAAIIYPERVVFIDAATDDLGSLDLGGYTIDDTDVSSDGNLYFSDDFVGIFRASPGMATPERIVATSGYTLDHDPKVSPDNTKLFYVHHEYGTLAKLCVYDMARRSSDVLYETTTDHNDALPAAWVDNDHVAFVNAGGGVDRGLNIIRISTKEVIRSDTQAGMLLEGGEGKCYYYMASVVGAGGDVAGITLQGLETPSAVRFHSPSFPYLYDTCHGVFVFCTSANGADGVYLWRQSDTFGAHLITVEEIARRIGSEERLGDLNGVWLLPHKDE